MSKKLPKKKTKTKRKRAAGSEAKVVKLDQYSQDYCNVKKEPRK